jgi:predicted phage terminase large subunit-like protein
MDALGLAQDDLDQLEEDLLALERARLRRSLYAFLQECWAIVEPSQPFVTNWHIEVMCQLLQDIATGKEPVQRWIFNISPGTMKSLLISVVFPAWVWARNSKKRFLTASYGQHLTVRDNLRVREIVQSPWFQRLFAVKLLEDQNTKTRYNTSDGGWRIATSVDGVGTGEHPDFIIIDDPTTAAQAESEAERTMANQWFDRTISSRGIGRGVTIIVVMQRLHEGDFTGHLLKKGGWGHVRFPMRFEKCTCPGPLETIPEDVRCPLHKADPNWVSDPRDPRTTPGELMFPALFNEQKVRQLELDLGPYGTAGQLQQRPAPEGGGLFKREWFKYADAVPAIVRRVRGWDTASTQGGGDYTVGVKICEGFAWLPSPENPRVRVLQSTGQFFIEDVKRDQLGPAGVDAFIRTTAEADGKNCPVREEKDPGGAGKTQVAARARLLAGYDYGVNTVGTSKIMRAKPFRAQCEAGNVFLVRGTWNEEYLKELCSFPTGTYDDQVDGSSCGFNALLLEPPPRQTDCTW